MPLIDPQKRAKRVERRKARRERIKAFIKNISQEVEEFLDEVEEEVTDIFGPGAPDTPDDIDATKKVGK